MTTSTLIDRASDILAELNWIENNIMPDEYEEQFSNNLDEAGDLLKEVLELIGAHNL